MTVEEPKLEGLVPDHLRVRSSRILLDALEVRTDIGFHEFEIGTPQRLRVNIAALHPALRAVEVRAVAVDRESLPHRVEELLLAAGAGVDLPGRGPGEGPRLRPSRSVARGVRRHRAVAPGSG